MQEVYFCILRTNFAVSITNFGMPFNAVVMSCTITRISQTIVPDRDQWAIAINSDFPIEQRTGSSQSLEEQQPK
jgi:hypothetical protein